MCSLLAVVLFGQGRIYIIKIPAALPSSGPSDVRRAQTHRNRSAFEKLTHAQRNSRNFRNVQIQNHQIRFQIGITQHSKCLLTVHRDTNVHGRQSSRQDLFSQNQIAGIVFNQEDGQESRSLWTAQAINDVTPHGYENEKQNSYYTPQVARSVKAIACYSMTQHLSVCKPDLPGMPTEARERRPGQTGLGKHNPCRCDAETPQNVSSTLATSTIRSVLPGHGRSILSHVAGIVLYRNGYKVHQRTR